jgi:hypothetical protein
MNRRRLSSAFRFDRSPAILFLLLLSLATGCEFDATGTGNGDAPDLGCDHDLKTYNIQFDLDPNGAGLQVEGNPLTGVPFIITWVYNYDGYDPEDSNEEYPYVTRIEILKDDEVIFAHDFDSGPVDLGDYGSYELLMENGLPAGHYLVTVYADPDGVVPECFSLPAALNNSTEADLIVESEPIDELVQPDDDAGSTTDSDPIDGFAQPDDHAETGTDEEPVDAFVAPATTRQPVPADITAPYGS